MIENKPIPVKEYIFLNIAIVLLTAIGTLLGIETFVGAVLICALLVVIIIRTRPVLLLISVGLMQTVYMLVSARGDLYMLVNTLPAALLMGYLYKTRKSLLQILVGGVVGYGISMAIVFTWSGSDSFSMLLNDLKSAVESYVSNQAVLYGYGIDIQTANYEYIVSMMPSSLVVMMLCFVFAAFYIAKLIVTRLNPDYNYFRPFILLRADKVSTIVYIVVFLGALFLKGVIGTVFLNLQVLLAAYFMLCGLAILLYYLRIIPSLSFRILLCLLVVTLSFLLVFAAIIDAWRDLRRLGGGSEV